MGLDMYLYTNSKKVCQEVNDQSDEWEGGFQTPRGIAIQWRKANAVHKWFVDNVQGGNDDCGLYEVDLSDLVRLHDICKEVLDSTKLVDFGTTDVYDFETKTMVKKPLQVLEDDKVARELLPTRGGFFFGDTAYDQWYWWDLQFTELKLSALLDCVKPGEHPWLVVHEDEPDWYVKFYYQSSW